MRSKSNWFGKLALVGLAAGLLVGMSGLAAARGLPKTFAWTAYGTTSSGYAVSVAIGNALSEAGYKLRVLPAKNDISRMVPLRSGRVQFSAMGVGAYLAQEGVLDFGEAKWGPQAVRLILMSWADTNTGLPGTAKDANIKTAADMKGKKIAWVKGAPALNQNMTAWLAFGGLTWADVTKVEVGGWKASIQGIIDGNIDAAIGSTDSSMFHQVAGSPRGLSFFPAPAAETENWKRLNGVAPWFAPHTATAGVGLSPEKPLEGASYGYPILITYDRQDSDAVYDLVKLFHTRFDAYKDAHVNGKGWAIDRQVFDWVLPYDEGAVRYFKEIGVWNDKFEENNNNLLKRQGVLQAAWKKAKAKRSGGEGYRAFWMQERANALKAAGMDPVWEK
jgi:TRAP transporter TAXI family solute receptor